MAVLIDLIFGVFALTWIATFVGYKIDIKLGTTPLLSILFGISAIIFGLARLVMKANKLVEKEEKSNNNDR